MNDNSESFRNEFVSRMYSKMPQDQLKDVLSVIDSVMSGYTVNRKQMYLIPADGISEVVLYFLACKAVDNLSPSTLKLYKLRLDDFFGMVRKPYNARPRCST